MSGLFVLGGGDGSEVHVSHIVSVDRRASVVMLFRNVQCNDTLSVDCFTI